MKKVFLLLFLITSLQSFSQLTINEGFENSSFPPIGWNVYSPNPLNWTKSSNNPHSGAYSIYLPNWNTSSIVTPIVHIMSNQDSLIFWTRYTYTYTAGILSVYASTTGNTTNDIDTSLYIFRKIINHTSNGWIRNSIPLNNFIGQSIYLHIKYDSWKTIMFIDDISIPNNTSSYVITERQTNINQNSATLNGTYYNNNNEITSKGFIWKNADTNLWNTVYVSSDSLKHNLSNLTADTKYEHKAFITTNTDTLYGDIEYFYTDYLINNTHPLFESFEDSIFPSNGWANLADSSINVPWERSSDLSKTGNYSAFRAYWNSSWLVSPLVKIQDNFDTLSFWYNASTYSGESPGKLSIYISDSCDFNTCRDLNNLISLTSINSAYGWVNIKVPLTDYNNKKVYIGIKYDSWMWQMYLDDISGVLYAQNLNDTTSYVITERQTNVNQNSATLNGTFNNNNNEITSKGFIWRNADTNLWNTVYVSSDSLKHNLSNLTADTKYEHKAFITTNTDTLYGDIEYFYTDYLINNTHPLFESFEDSIFPSNGWANLADSSINVPWERSSDLSKTGNYSAFRAYWNSSWLVSPLVKIQDNFDTLSFWYNASTYSGESPGKLSIYISDSCDFNTCRDLNNLISLTSINSAYGWVNIKVPLTDYNNKKVYIGIKYDSWMWQMYLDDISGVLYAQNPLGLNRNEINPKITISIYPNPASKEATLSMENINGSVLIVIRDIQGRTIKTIKEKASNSLNKTIDLSQLSKGEYFISIINKDIQQTKKLIIQ